MIPIWLVIVAAFVVGIGVGFTIAVLIFWSY